MKQESKWHIEYLNVKTYKKQNLYLAYNFVSTAIAILNKHYAADF